MKKYNVIVAGTVFGTYKTKEEAEKMLDEVKKSFLALIHPKDCMYIKEA